MNYKKFFKSLLNTPKRQNSLLRSPFTINNNFSHSPSKHFKEKEYKIWQKEIPDRKSEFTATFANCFNASKFRNLNYDVNFKKGILIYINPRTFKSYPLYIINRFEKQPLNEHQIKSRKLSNSQKDQKAHFSLRSQASSFIQQIQSKDLCCCNSTYLDYNNILNINKIDKNHTNRNPYINRIISNKCKCKTLKEISIKQNKNRDYVLRSKIHLVIPTYISSLIDRKPNRLFACPKIN